MAEGLIEGLLGSEPDEEDLTAEIAVESTDQTAKNLALDHGGKTPRWRPRPPPFLDEQTRFLRIQMEHLQNSAA